ncbi:MAG TPA: S8 family serine peptidase, partial [Kofleriaceae bacterium]|nr:S8 family serine peptidase [Kofleriaceae bacterium]
VAGDVMTARIPAGRVLDVAAARAVKRLEAGRPVHPKLDVVVPEVGADLVHAGEAPLVGPATGAGVLVGVIDIGLDFEHPAFWTPDGATRVVELWDQTVTDNPPAGYSYGSTCSAADIEAGGCAHMSEESHGTHVTGIAAGGWVDGVPHVGLAPEADIAFVNLGPAPSPDESEALTTAICDGAAWIYGVADRLGRPAVINMSLGLHTDAHDGSSLASRCLDNLAGAGRLMVAAAGNEGQGATHPILGEQVLVHLGGVADEVPQLGAFLLAAAPGANPGEFQVGQELYFWFDEGSDLRLRVGVADADDNLTFSDEIGIDAPLEPALLSTPFGDFGPVVAAGGELESGVRGIQIRVDDENGDAAEGEQLWVVEVTGSGPFDGFIDTTSAGGFVDVDGVDMVPDSDMTIGFPAVTRNVIAVASYVTRDQWQDASGATHEQVNAQTGEPVVAGDLSAFSSHGPSRNEALTGIKPDIAAPGELVASAFNLYSEAPAERIAIEGEAAYMYLEGTSMASPAVAGIAALLLQADPQMTPDQLREVLQASAREPLDDAYLWGGGKVDAFAALEILDSDPGADDDGGDGSDDGGDAGDGSDDDGGGCQTSPGSGSGSGAALLMIAVGLLALRRRRAVNF